MEPTLYRYTFKHRIDGHLLSTVAFSENAAKANLGGVDSTWYQTWECHDDGTGRAVWHYTADGQIHDGARS